MCFTMLDVLSMLCGVVLLIIEGPVKATYGVMFAICVALGIGVAGAAVAVLSSWVKQWLERREFMKKVKSANGKTDKKVEEVKEKVTLTTAEETDKETGDARPIRSPIWKETDKKVKAVKEKVILTTIEESDEEVGDATPIRSPIWDDIVENNGIGKAKAKAKEFLKELQEMPQLSLEEQRATITFPRKDIEGDERAEYEMEEMKEAECNADRELEAKIEARYRDVAYLHYRPPSGEKRSKARQLRKTLLSCFVSRRQRQH